MGLFLNIYFKTSIKANDYSFYKCSSAYYVPGTTRGHEQNRPRAPAFMESTFYWGKSWGKTRGDGEENRLWDDTCCEENTVGQARVRSHAVQLPGTHLERLRDCSPGASTAGDGRAAPHLAEMPRSFCVKSAPWLESSRGNFHFTTVLTKIS